MVRKSGQAISMRRICVIEARIFGFYCFETSIEAVRLDADFGYEISNKVLVEVWRIRSGRMGK
jgi:hypothetical protein